ncbi:MAG TPA: hypothetical protein VIH00_03355 [Candidatus Limnocylindrales bacterium]
MRPTRADLAFGLAALITAGLLQAPGLIAGPSLDAAVFTVVGRELLAGAPLYAGVWDQKGPGVYLLAAAAQAALPIADPSTALWVLSTLAAAASAVLVRSIGRADGMGRTADVAGILAIPAMTMFPLALGGGESEALALPVALGAVRLAVGPDPIGGGRSMLSGAILVAAGLISVQVLAAGAAILVVWWRMRHGLRWLGARLLWAAGGGVLMLATTAAWLSLSGSIDAAYDALVTFNGAYVALARGRWPTGLLSSGAVDIAFCLAPYVVLALVGSRTAGVPGGRLPWLAWLLADLVLILGQARAEGHYAIAVAPPLALLAAPGVVWVFREVSWRRPGWLVGVGALAVAVALAFTYTAVVTGAALEGRGHNHRTQAQAVAAALDRLGVDGSILVWGNEPGLYLSADRPVAGRYVHIFGLTTPGYSTPGQVEELVAELRRRPPAAIVDAGSPAPGAPGTVALLVPRPLASYAGHDLDVIDALRRFVAERYVVGATVEGWIVYVPR